MQNKDRLQCECGKQFSTQQELQQHQQNCAMARASKGKTRSAGGQDQQS